MQGEKHDVDAKAIVEDVMRSLPEVKMKEDPIEIEVNRVSLCDFSEDERVSLQIQKQKEIPIQVSTWSALMQECL